MLIHNIEISHISVCDRCGVLTGVIPIGERTFPLLCSCRGVAERQAVKPPAGADFLPLVDLCACCALTPVKSGSRFSPLYCDICQEMIRSINNDLGMLLIPMGRHSMMNGIKCAKPQSAEAIAGFAQAFSNLSDRLDVVFEWKRMTVRRTLTVLDLKDGAPVPFEKYLLFTDGAMRPHWKRLGVKRLAQYFGAPDGYFVRTTNDETIMN